MPRNAIGLWYTPPLPSTPKATAISTGVMPLEPSASPKGVLLILLSDTPNRSR